jgi:hypothetical protein
MRLISIGVVCAMALAGSIDDAHARTSYAGVKGGVNIADITGDNLDGLDSRNRFIGGAFYGMDFTDDFGVRIDGLYVQKGAEGPIPIDDGDIHDVIISLDYIEFPVLFMVGFPTSDTFAVNLFAGPTFGFNITAEMEIPEHGETEDLDVETFELGGTSINDDFDGKNNGIGIMVGVKFPFGAGE